MLAAVIGAGRIGALFEQDRLRKKPCTHLGAWQKVADRVIFAEPVDRRRELVDAEFHPDGSYADYKAMLAFHSEKYNAGPKIDVVSVATPPETHEQIVLEIARRKAAKVVFCEKPIAPTLEAARRMITACDQAGIKLAVNHTRRWEANWQYGKHVVALKKYGEVVGSVAYYVGDYIEAGTHVADLLNWYGIESQVYNLNGIEYLVFELDVFFQYGRVRIIDNGREVEIYQSEKSSNYEYYNELMRMMPELPKDEETPMLAACRQLKACAEDPGLVPMCTAGDGYLALERALKWKEFSQAKV